VNLWDPLLRTVPTNRHSVKCHSRLFYWAKHGATWETEIRRFLVPGKSKEKSLWDPILMRKKYWVLVACTCFSSYSGKLKMRGSWSRLSWAKNQEPISKVTTVRRARVMAQLFFWACFASAKLWVQTSVLPKKIARLFYLCRQTSWILQTHLRLCLNKVKATSWKKVWKQSGTIFHFPWKRVYMIKRRL
jgi:hypothetical protein